MPEGDTIFRAARTLHAALAGKAVVRFETVLPRLARVDEDARLAGRTVEAVAARGKHLLIRFSGGLTLRTHMRMNGSWHLYRPGERWRRPRAAMRIVVAVADAEAVAFDVPVAELLDDRALARQRELGALGPDLLAPDFDAAEAARRLRARPEAELGEALLDQRVLAGAGNVFKSEIAFLAGVHPLRPVGDLDGATLRRVVETARRLLLANAGSGRDGGRRTTAALDPGARLWVYGRGGEACRRCGTPIAFVRQGPHARVTYWCPRCQPVHARSGDPPLPPG
jgi:endonuclease VIII